MLAKYGCLLNITIHSFTVQQQEHNGNDINDISYRNSDKIILIFVYSLLIDLQQTHTMPVSNPHWI